MRAIVTGILGLFLVSQAAALPSFQTVYDLKCAGNVTGLADAKLETHAPPFTMTLHVDLDHKLFCLDECQTHEKISKIFPSNIIFRAIGGPSPNRLWVADTGQFSYTWVDAAAQSAKPAMRSVQGFCTKVLGSSDDRKNPDLKPVRPTVEYRHAATHRSEGLSEREIRALIFIKNHRAFPASMHTQLWLKGLAQFQDGRWVLTAKGEAIITGDGR